MSILKNKWFDFFLFKKGKSVLFGVFFCLIISTCLGYQTPLMIKELLAYYQDKDAFYTSVNKLGILFFLVYLNRVIYGLFLNLYIKLFMQRLRIHCFKKWLSHHNVNEGREKDRFPQGEVVARIMNDTLVIRELITSGTLSIFIDGFFVLSSFLGLISIEKISGLFFSGMVFLAVVLLIWGGRHMRAVFYRVRQARGMIYQNLANVVGGIRDNYYTDHQNYASKTGSVVFNNFLRKQINANFWDSSYYSLAESLHPLLLALLIVVFPYSEIASAAVIFAIVDVIQRSITPLKSIAGKITNIQQSLTSISMIQGFIDHFQKEIPRKTQDSPLNFTSIEVIIDHFSYGASSVSVDKTTSFSLDSIAFTASKGELLGLAGHSGQGKSTLLNIMAANIIPSRGRIVLRGDNRVIHFPDGDVADYRGQVGLVAQDSHVFSESLQFNITLGLDSHEEFMDFWSWAREMISYLGTWKISPRNIIRPCEMSLGQNQLICALRACFLKKEVVLFDEISSGMDSELEESLRKTIWLVQKNSLSIIVAHRLETLLQADRILLIEKGRIVGEGTHKELLDKSPYYVKFISHLHRDRPTC